MASSSARPGSVYHSGKTPQLGRSSHQSRDHSPSKQSQDRSQPHFQHLIKLQVRRAEAIMRARAAGMGQNRELANSATASRRAGREMESTPHRPSLVGAIVLCAGCRSRHRQRALRGAGGGGVRGERGRWAQSPGRASPSPSPGWCSPLCSPGWEPAYSGRPGKSGPRRDAGRLGNRDPVRRLLMTTASRPGTRRSLRPVRDVAPSCRRQRGASEGRDHA